MIIQIQVGHWYFVNTIPTHTIKVAVSDLGIGIPIAVKAFMEKEGFHTLSNEECIKWAMQKLQFY
ncbi:MAG: hypothetical protein R2728_00710 [Chitinophagales bacterium]